MGVVGNPMGNPMRMGIAIRLMMGMGMGIKPIQIHLLIYAPSSLLVYRFDQVSRFLGFRYF